MNESTALGPAGLGRRVLVVLIDAHCFTWGWVLTAWCLAWSRDLSVSEYLDRLGPGFDLGWALATFVPTLLVLACWLLGGATPGNLVTATRVVDACTGRRPRFWQCLVRLFPLLLFVAATIYDDPEPPSWWAWVSWVPLVVVVLSYVAVAVGPRRQALHDRLARTLVVRVDRDIVADAGRSPSGVVAPPLALAAVVAIVANAAQLRALRSVGWTVGMGWMAWRVVRDANGRVAIAALAATALFLVDSVGFQLAWELASGTRVEMPVLVGPYWSSAWAIFVGAVLVGYLALFDLPGDPRRRMPASVALLLGRARQAWGWVAATPRRAAIAGAAAVGVAGAVATAVLAPPAIPGRPGDRLLCYSSHGVWVATPDGTGRVRVLPRRFTDGEISPDGRTVVALESRHRFLVLARLGTRAVQRLDALGSHVGPASWSPDGSLLLFQRFTGERWDTVVAAPDGSRFKRLTRSLPDSTWRGCWVADGTSAWVYDFANLYRVDLDGKVVERVPIGVLHSSSTSTEWSCSAHPDGRRVLWHVHGCDDGPTPRLCPPSVLVLYDAVTRVGTRVSPPGITAAGPAWAPDGREFYFSARVGPSTGVYRMAPGDTDATLVVPEGHSPSLSRGVRPVVAAVSR